MSRIADTATFLTNQQFYETDEITPHFLELFQKLSEPAKKIVRSRNQVLEQYLQENDPLSPGNLTKDLIDPESVVIYQLKGKSNHCPQHKERDLLRKKVIVSIEKHRQAVFVEVCPVCGKFYSKSTNSIKGIFDKSGTKYQIISGEDGEA